MKFINIRGQIIEFDPFNQEFIDAAKAQAPGECLGPVVSAELAIKIASGEITQLDQLPSEYQNLGQIWEVEQ